MNSELYEKVTKYRDLLNESLRALKKEKKKFENIDYILDAGDYQKNRYEIIGIICEYNPFHNGHLYHINKIKELFPDSLIILVLNGYFFGTRRCFNYF